MDTAGRSVLIAAMLLGVCRVTPSNAQERLLRSRFSQQQATYVERDAACIQAAMDHPIDQSSDEEAPVISRPALAAAAATFDRLEALRTWRTVDDRFFEVADAASLSLADISIRASRFIDGALCGYLADQYKRIIDYRRNHFSEAVQEAERDEIATCAREMKAVLSAGRLINMPLCLASVERTSAARELDSASVRKNAHRPIPSQH